ncbi:MAG: anti-sigma factor [Chloroflexi bacterium]|nr:anti-sigma factor [Chloroflexota bacterium]
MNDPRSHETIFSDLPGYALDALDEDARRLVDEHLTECDDCTTELEELMEGAGNLAFAVPPVSPPEELRDRIRTAIEREPSPISAQARAAVTAEELFGSPAPGDIGENPTPVAEFAMASPVHRPWYASPRLAWTISTGIAAAFVSVVAVGAIINVRLNDRIDELSEQVVAQERSVATVSASVGAIERNSERSLDEVQQVSILQESADTLEQQVNDLRWLQYVTSSGDWLTPSFFSGGLQPQAPQGMLITHSSGDRALLMVNGLAPAPAGTEYQVWLKYEGRQVPGSTFTVDRNGYAVVDLHLIGDATEYIGALVTVEPTGGSETPSDFVVLIGTSK